MVSTVREFAKEDQSPRGSTWAQQPYLKFSWAYGPLIIYLLDTELTGSRWAVVLVFDPSKDLVPLPKKKTDVGLPGAFWNVLTATRNSGDRSFMSASS